MEEKAALYSSVLVQLAYINTIVQIAQLSHHMSQCSYQSIGKHKISTFLTSDSQKHQSKTIAVEIITKYCEAKSKKH